MIKNEQQLAIVREQLATAEAALDAIRREVRPQNEKLYLVMAESYIDVLLSLRTEIDEYLGIGRATLSADSSELLAQDSSIPPK